MSNNCFYVRFVFKYLCIIMKSVFRSHNTKESSGLIKFLMPSSERLVLSFILGSTFLILLNSRAIWLYSTVGIQQESQLDLGSLIQKEAPWIVDVFNRVAHGIFPQIVFWIFIGCLTYITLWLVQSLITNVRNDFVADSYQHPSSYKRSGYWSSILSRKIFFVSLLTIFAAYSYYALKILILLSNLTLSGLFETKDNNSTQIILTSVITATVLTHVFFLLLKLLKNSWDYIYKDL